MRIAAAVLSLCSGWVLAFEVHIFSTLNPVLGFGLWMGTFALFIASGLLVVVPSIYSYPNYQEDGSCAKTADNSSTTTGSSAATVTNGGRG